MLEDVLKNKEEGIERAKLALANLKMAALTAAPIQAKLSDVGGECSVDGRIFHWGGIAWGEVVIAILLSDQESWGAAAPFLEAAEEFGFESTDWSSFDDAKNFARTYTASKVEEEAIAGVRSKQEVTIRITIALKEGNTGGCRRVFVGTHKETSVVETQEYQLICDEAPA